MSSTIQKTDPLIRFFIRISPSESKAKKFQPPLRIILQSPVLVFKQFLQTVFCLPLINLFKSLRYHLGGYSLRRKHIPYLDISPS